MAAVLRVESYDASEYVSLLGPEISLERKSGDMVIDPADPFVTTVFKVNVNDGNAADTRTAVNTLINLLEAARQWREDDLMSDSTWLRFASDGETAKRARVVTYSFKNNAGAGVDPYQLLTHRLSLDLAITRERDAEDATPVIWSSLGSNASLVNGYGFYRHYNSGYVSAGTKGGRIFMPISPSISSGVLDKFWIGIRKERYGYSSYAPIFRFHDASGNTRPADVDYVAKSGAYSPTVARVRFSTSGGVDALSWRQFITLGDVMAGNYHHMVGEYQMLLRYQVDSGTRVSVRGGMSYTPDPGTAAYNGVQYDLTADGQWHFLQVGVMRFPPRGWRELTRSTSYGNIDLSNLTIWVDAERLSGSGFVYLDVLKPIPYDHYLAVSGLNSSDGDYFMLATHENGQIEAFNRASAGLSPITGYAQTAEARNWGVPDTEFFVVAFAGERSTGSFVGDQATLYTPTIWRRWGAYHA